MPWQATVEPLPTGRAIKLTPLHEGAPMTFAEVLRLWGQDAPFRAWFNDQLAGQPFQAFRWETPPITAGSVHRPFECVIADDPGLAVRPDPRAFSGHFGGPDPVVDFLNLGRDARLVVPLPRAADHACYAHLAAFVRHAPAEQRDALWMRVGEAAARRLGERAVWISTAGAGVAWLHVRLDDRPKYYVSAGYRQAAG